MKKKIITLSLLSFLLVFLISFFVTANEGKTESSGYSKLTQSLDTTTNFFTQKENTEKINIEDKTSSLNLLGYKEVASNDKLKLYRLDKTMGIALVDKATGYTWFSSYEKYSSLGLTDKVKSRIESGVTIEYYDANGSTINFSEVSLTDEKNGAKTPKYTKIANGFNASINFEKYGITFEVNVSLDGSNLLVEVPSESVKEETVGKLNPKNYQLKSITLYPYLGSQNYEINGYSFIPDGSGALIRYTNESSSTAFVKKVYGADYGIAVKTTSNDHIKESGNVTLPIFGVNHGYNQAAFLCQITAGDGAAEIHSYPYKYNNLAFNTTFFKFNTRDTYLVDLSNSSQLNLINETWYPSNYALKYSFLNNENANYIGMANEYRKSLELDAHNLTGDIPLHLTMLGVDYKAGLFGKNYIEMTKYKAALNIVKELNSLNVNNMQLTYLGWNKGGYFNDGANNAKLHGSLGSKKDFKNLVNYINDNGMSIDFTVSPSISDSYGFGSPTIKKINLSSFDKLLTSSLVQKGYYTAPSKMAKAITKNSKKYRKLGINSLNLDNISDSYSYRYGNSAIYRSEMIDILCEQLDKVENLNLSTTTPNGYLLKYLSNYYEASYESSKYLYETDSIPFISILLSGYVNMFSPNINYISDYNLLNLRMIEYNLYPSFIITDEEAYKLRFTNFEYLNSTEYSLWSSLMVSMYQTVNSALSYVNGQHITSHRYIDDGICEIGYSNGKVIYINYNDTPYSNGSLNIDAYQYLVK